jgi:triosephosphate isomerase
MGNWKLNGSRHMVNELVANLRKELAGVTGCAVAIAPPDMYLDLAKHAADGSHIILGAQNVDVNLSGAFTGETSAEMLKDIGAKYIIIGHSERRTYHKESDEFIAKKFAVLKEQGLIPVLCIGETEAENEAGKTEEVCTSDRRSAENPGRGSVRRRSNRLRASLGDRYRQICNPCAGSGGSQIHS